VKWHLKNIYARMGAVSRDEAVARGRDLGLLFQPDNDKPAPHGRLIPPIKRGRERRGGSCCKQITRFGCGRYNLGAMCLIFVRIQTWYSLYSLRTFHGFAADHLENCFGMRGAVIKPEKLPVTGQDQKVLPDLLVASNPGPQT
jgi:hypothetical protein